MCPRVFSRSYHAFDAAVSEAARYDNTVHVSELAFRVSFLQPLRVDPLHIHMDTVAASRMIERFEHGKIRVMQTCILADKTDPDAVPAVFYPFNHLDPVRHVRLGSLYA